MDSTVGSARDLQRNDASRSAERHGGRSLQSTPPTAGLHPPISRLTLALVALYVLVQLLVPFRHFLYPGNVDWTEEGYHFSWRMMLNEKPAVVQFLAEKPSGEKFAVDPRAYLSPHQIQRMARDPEMLREFAAFLKRDLAKEGHPDLKIRVIALVSLNGRKPQLLVDPTIDLASQPRSWLHQPWIMPLQEPLRLPPWNVPPQDWPKYVEVPQ
jgi:vitamin K-dependent gamma-carboxylase